MTGVKVHMFEITVYVHPPGTSPKFPVIGRISDISLISSAGSEYSPQNNLTYHYGLLNLPGSPEASQIIAITRVSLSNSNNGLHLDCMSQHAALTST